MKVSRLKTSLLIFLLTFFSITVSARAFDDDDDSDDYDVKDRVVRISLTTGEVNLKRKGNTDWENARLNYPLVEGDTIATGKDSRMEIQVDARNFVRLAPETALRIVTLRDEGVALSVLQGTIVVRLVKFDRTHEYFEVDAPRTTMAAEKAGLYRIDVPNDGRVRLTVRDGGTARIYSDTSGFSLRENRTAELVVSGDTAGDWNLAGALPPDAIDDWINDRERYLAQQLRYDAEYYDDYVWGAEELAAYGQWTYTSDFGWIWQPNPSTISPYGDWAPYRYGRWVWCPPYGWTWVGSEPWGWAPYHYGRWVLRNNVWAWVPRSQYNRRRSWWRPALVVFVSLDFSFGNDICWYPLPYYQHDPYSRRYRHSDRPYYPGRGNYGGNRPPAGGGAYGGSNRPPGAGAHGSPSGPGGVAGGGGTPQPVRDPDHKDWRGVTRVPRRDFGNGDQPGRPADERTARRVIDSAPDLNDLPRRIGVPAATSPVQLPEATTGAAERRPGAPLDDDLRRSRIFRGREPRVSEPVQGATQPGLNRSRPTDPSATNPSVPRRERSTQPVDPSTQPAGSSAQPTSPTVNTSVPSVETPPSGAVSRPET